MHKVGASHGDILMAHMDKCTLYNNDVMWSLYDCACDMKKCRVFSSITTVLATKITIAHIALHAHVMILDAHM